MPVFVALAAFLFLIYAHRVGIPLGPLFGSNSPFGGSRKSPGQKSAVRTPTLEMELDHDSGRMEGRCLKGQYAGRFLSSLNQNELLRLYDELRTTDHQGALLIEAYLDRRWSGWRHRHSAADAASEERTQSRAPDSRMAPTEAYAVLGLKTGADEAEIRSAHRKLMMKHHPDQGGSAHFAARINEAKEVLLGRK